MAEIIIDFSEILALKKTLDQVSTRGLEDAMQTALKTIKSRFVDAVRGGMDIPGAGEGGSTAPYFNRRYSDIAQSGSTHVLNNGLGGYFEVSDPEVADQEERYQPPWDMKPGLLSGPDAKWSSGEHAENLYTASKSKMGGHFAGIPTPTKYVRIPFQHTLEQMQEATPGLKKMAQKLKGYKAGSEHAEYRQQMREMGLLEIDQSKLSMLARRSPPTPLSELASERLHEAIHAERVEHEPRDVFALIPTRTREYETYYTKNLPSPFSLWGEGLQSYGSKASYVRKAAKFERMVRIIDTSKPKISSMYTTFRTVSTMSDPMAWIHPGHPARPVTQTVADNVRDEVVNIISDGFWAQYNRNLNA